MKKKLILLLLAFSLILCFNLSAYAAQPVPRDYATACGLIREICPGVVREGDGNYTRMEFLRDVVGMFGAIDASGLNCSFLDVAQEDRGIVGFAEGIGLISEGELFYPDEELSAGQAFKIMAEALGYGALAEAFGGYPIGYIQAVREADITKGVNIKATDKVTYATGLVMLSNMLHADIYNRIEYGAQIATYKKSVGKNMLEVYHNIRLIDGIMTANKYTGLYDAEDCSKENSLRVGTETYFGGGYADYLGQRVILYYRDDAEKSVVYMYPYRNTVSKIFTSDDPSMSGNTLSFYGDNGKEKSLNLSEDYVVIYNGKNFAASDLGKYITPEDGNITLLDNNYDGKFDVIFVKDIQYGVVSRINLFEKKIYDKYRVGGIVDLSEKEEVSFVVTLPDGSEGDLTDISEESVIGTAYSLDKKMCRIYLYNSYVAGIVNAKSDDGRIIVDNKEYKLSKYFSDNIGEIYLGVGSVCYLGENDEIVYIDSTAKAMKYAYLVNMAEPAGLSENVAVKLFDQEGSMRIVYLADKVRIDGNSYKKSKAYTELSGLLLREDSARVLKYSLNSEGKINAIARTRDIATLAEVFSQYDADAGPVLYCSETCNYRYGIFSPRFYGGAQTVYIKVPTDDEDKRNDKKYSAVSSTYFSNGNYFVSAYDVDRGGSPAFVLVSESGDTLKVSETTPAYVVEETYFTLNEDGEQVCCVHMYGNDTYGAYYSNENTEKIVRALKPGDLVRAEINAEHEITTIQLDFEFETKTVEASVSELDNGSGRVVEYLSGNVYSCTTGSALLVPYGTDMSKNLLPGNVKCTNLTPGKTVFVKFAWNRDGTIKSAEVYTEESLDAIESYLEAGEGCNYIVSKQRYRVPSLTVVYNLD